MLQRYHFTLVVVVLLAMACTAKKKNDGSQSADTPTTKWSQVIYPSDSDKNFELFVVDYNDPSAKLTAVRLNGALLQQGDNFISGVVDDKVKETLNTDMKNFYSNYKVTVASDSLMTSLRNGSFYAHFSNSTFDFSKRGKLSMIIMLSNGQEVSEDFSF